MAKNINMPQQAQSSQTIANKGNNNMNIISKTRINKIQIENYYSQRYMDVCINQQLNKLTGNPTELLRLQECAKCGHLLHSDDIQNYTVTSHYHIEGSCDIYVVAETQKSMYGFSIASYWGCTYFETNDKKHYQKYLLADSTYVGKTVAEIIKEFNIPCAEEVLSRYVPAPHLEIGQIIKDSYEYVNDCIMPKVKRVSKDSEEWKLMMDFCHGSILVNTPIVLNLTVKGHYQDKDGTDYFMVHEDNGILHYLAFRLGGYCGFVRYCTFSDTDLKQCKKSEFIGKKIKEIVGRYHIPFLYEMPEVFNYWENIYNYLPSTM